MPSRSGSIQIWKSVVVSGSRFIRVADPGAGAHHLHVASFGAPLVAEAVRMGYGALAHIGDDLHVGVGVRRKARMRRDLVVVPHPERAPAHALGS